MNIIMNLIAILAIIGVLAAFVAGAFHNRGNGFISAANDTYDGAVETHECAVNRTNDAAIAARHLLYKQGAADTSVAACGAAEIPLGTIDNIETGTGANQSVLLLGKGGTKKMVASEAITAGEQVFTAASGKVQDTPTGATVYLVGTALTPAGADGDIIEVLDCPPVKFVFA